MKIKNESEIQVVVFQSELTVKEIMDLKRYNPELLVKTDEEGNQVFRIDFNDVEGDICKYAVIFDKETTEGNALYTVSMKATNEEVARNFISVKRNVEEIEEKAMNYIRTLEEDIMTLANEIGGANND
ncbi:MAG: hypothetical protein MJ191_00250 [Clostridium sp.]|nr:hypothetical protein [Clostridium sp.]